MGNTVMVVEDNPTTRHLIGLYLKGQGYALLQAENGLDALEQLAQGAVDLIITDVNMPQMDGVALTRALKQDQALATIPVLILTSEDGAKERRNGLAAGAAAYLTKPVSSERLVQEVTQLLVAPRG